MDGSKSHYRVAAPLKLSESARWRQNGMVGTGGRCVPAETVGMSAPMIILAFLFLSETMDLGLHHACRRIDDADSLSVVNRDHQ